MKINFLKSVALLGFVILSAISCQDDDNNDPNKVNADIDFTTHSKIPAFVYAMSGFEDLKISTLITSADVLPESPTFVYGAQPDGAGIMRNPNGEGYIMITNHEIVQSVSRVYLDKTFKPVKGDYLVDAIGGLTRLCSATLATPEIHGFGPIFLTAGESGQESMVHGINPLGSSADKSKTDRVLPALGKASMENAVPLPKEAYPGKTVILIGEDQSYAPSHVSAGQLIMYMSTTGDLSNGKLYALKRTDGNQVETSITLNNSYPVSFVEIPNAKNLTGAVINTTVNSLGAIRFSRVEDVDYRKGSASNNREVYFTATGQSPDYNTPVEGYTMWGRVYKLKMDANDPLKGTLELAVEGDSTPGTGIINPDNLCVTENYVYIQEDGDSYYTNAKHDSYIWQYNIGTKQNKPWLNMNHKRTDVAWNDLYNQTGQMKFGSWEFGAMQDISDIIGVPDTFTVNIHPHTWQSDKFKNADGSGVSDIKEGGQTVIIRNAQR
ncbi:hypothetical protein GON26_10280 [Flavobacterium sp. GA093]|uniref:DUF839 domain-containing protein n=1 Tax=Flavobacterium hydrocarbonoxydans TaxID=2683249 RepID=A0A6I4NP44_9FLAO|nr:hypothetical protein [Flavobacterium hydrocarbonoxydans]MWB94752.1 hypothetical protein [Flavobacterium hydrocarbonoxydans]